MQLAGVRVIGLSERADALDRDCAQRRDQTYRFFRVAQDT
jgi:hypothetical protein